jgi:hypothetical protein
MTPVPCTTISSKSTLKLNILNVMCVNGNLKVVKVLKHINYCTNMQGFLFAVFLAAK